MKVVIKAVVACQVRYIQLHGRHEPRARAQRLYTQERLHTLIACRPPAAVGGSGRATKQRHDR